ncbi:MAG TPA: CapA family protein [Thermoguttaceae bacterium]|nr:CapA family protein [Thermoguttaceae bacterium]
MSIVFAGDYLPRRRLERSAFPENSRIVANLECAIADNATEALKSHPLVLGTEADRCVAQGEFAALSLANNHVSDAGSAAFDEMVRRLHRASNAQFYGTRANPFAVLDEAGRRVAVIGCMEPSRSRVGRLFRQEDVLSLIRDLTGRYDRIFVTPHWGKEGEFAAHPSPKQRSLARRWIEAGVHGVFGHHAHTFHGRERFDGAPVYYSLGNLAFDHEESRRYRLTEFGLLVTWTPGPRPEDDGWRETFVSQRESIPRELDDPTRRLLAEYLDAISNDLTERPWTCLRWARAVGGIYITKSRASWRKRFGGPHPWRSRWLRAIWAMLPSTVLLDFGGRFPDKTILARRAELERHLGAFPGTALDHDE